MVMLVAPLWVTLWAVSDSECDSTWPRTGLLRNCITEWEPSVTGAGHGGACSPRPLSGLPWKVATLLSQYTHCCVLSRYTLLRCWIVRLLWKQMLLPQATAFHVDRCNDCDKLVVRIILPVAVACCLLAAIDPKHSINKSQTFSPSSLVQ